jgi:poly-beta-1,6-N-acetyl-D-glucosamine synthase
MIELAIAALLVLGYTYLGYPLVMALRSRGREAIRGEAQEWEPMVSVLMSVHDAADRLKLKLENLLALDWPADRIEFLIYSDGSTDATDAIVLKYAARDSRIRFVRGVERRGKPTALNRLRKLASGSVLLLTDVRPLIDPAAVRLLVRPLSDPDVGCVSGNLILDGATGAGAYWRYEKLIRSSEGRTGGLVGVTGAVYAIRRQDFPELPVDLILDDMWVPLTVALRTGRRSIFSEHARAYDEAFEDDREFDRKVRTLAGNYQLVRKLPALLNPLANPLWFEMVSHKLLRLVCPWALMVLLVASGAAALSPGSSGPQRIVLGSLVAGQLVFYALAALGPLGGRVARLARTFVVLNAAAVVGLWRFARGTQKVTW